jgi:hypothetical protein
MMTGEILQAIVSGVPLKEFLFSMALILTHHFLDPSLLASTTGRMTFLSLTIEVAQLGTTRPKLPLRSD